MAADGMELAMTATDPRAPVQFPESLVDTAEDASMRSGEQGVPDMRQVTVALLRALHERCIEGATDGIASWKLFMWADELETK